MILPYIDVNAPRVNMCSPSWTPLPPPFHPIPLGHPSAPAPEHPISCIEPGWRFLYIIHTNKRSCIILNLHCTERFREWKVPGEMRSQSAQAWIPQRERAKVWWWRHEKNAQKGDKRKADYLLDVATSELPRALFTMLTKEDLNETGSLSRVQLLRPHGL